MALYDLFGGSNQQDPWSAFLPQPTIPTAPAAKTFEALQGGQVQWDPNAGMWGLPEGTTPYSSGTQQGFTLGDSRYISTPLIGAQGPGYVLGMDSGTDATGDNLPRQTGTAVMEWLGTGGDPYVGSQMGIYDMDNNLTGTRLYDPGDSSAWQKALLAAVMMYGGAALAGGTAGGAGGAGAGGVGAGTGTGLASSGTGLSMGGSGLGLSGTAGGAGYGLGAGGGLGITAGSAGAGTIGGGLGGGILAGTGSLLPAAIAEGAGGYTGGGLTLGNTGLGMSAPMGEGLSLAGTTNPIGITAASPGAGAIGEGLGTGIAAGTGSVLPAGISSGTGSSGGGIFETIKNIQSNPIVKAATSVLGGGSGGNGLGGLAQLIGAGQDIKMADKSADSILAWLQSQMDYMDKLYAPGTPEYDALWQAMSRKDAAAGRNSQYGPRSVDLAAKLADIKGTNRRELAKGFSDIYANTINKENASGAALAATLGSLLGNNSGNAGNSLSAIIDQIGGLFGGSGSQTSGTDWDKFFEGVDFGQYF